MEWNEPDSIDQEYHAFEAENRVWREVKGEQTDDQCDWASDLMGRGEADAKAELRQLYPQLPEYWSASRRP